MVPRRKWHSARPGQNFCFQSNSLWWIRGLGSLTAPALLALLTDAKQAATTR